MIAEGMWTTRIAGFLLVLWIVVPSCKPVAFTRTYYGGLGQFFDDGEEVIPEGASTLAFVFDITGSMYDDLVQVIEGAARIFSTILARREKAIHNYVLVPFHDPDIGPVTVTTDPDLFQRQLKELYVQGGGDCPEMSVGAIKLALEVCLPNSHIYVFTDARAKDYYLLDDVLKLIQRKQSQVVFVMTGDCGNHSHPGYQAYERIASTSSGQVFHLMKSDVDEVLNFVRVSLQARKVNLFAVDRAAGDLREFEFDVDGSLREFTISVSGENPVITVINSRGEVVDQRRGLLELLNHKNISIVNVKDPAPGRWKLRINSEGAHTIRATGLSNIDFVHGFSRQPTANLKETYHRPLKGAPTYLLVNATDLPNPATFKNVKIVDLEGNNLQNIPLYRFPGSNLFNASTFYPPNEYFYLKIAGSDEYGYPVERMTSTAISAQLPDAPEVSTRPRMNGYYDEDTDLRCYIQSLVPFSVTWYKDGVPISQQQHFPQTTEIVLTVPEVTLLSEGFYSCNATNIAGRASSVIFLDVKEPPPAITKSGNVSGIVGSLAVLPCEVDSVVEHNVTWARITLDDSNVKAAPLPDVSGIIVHGNDSVVIHNVLPDDEGWYRCTATNNGGIAQDHVFLHVYSVPVVQITPSTYNFTLGSFVNLSCSATGYPEPHVRWIWSPVHEKGFVSGKNKVIGRSLLVSSAEPEDEGRYDCIATNAAGTHVGRAFLNYIEAPHITLPDRELVVKNGEQAVLRCIGEGIPDPRIRWYKGPVEVQPLSYIQIGPDGSLLIYDVQETDAGNYTCVAENEAGTSNGTLFLNVGFEGENSLSDHENIFKFSSKPSLIKFPGVSSVNVMHNASIPCIATGTPSPSIRWLFKNGSRIDGGSESTTKLFVTSDGDLRIQEADPSVAGEYVCQVENKFGKAEQTLILTVTGIKNPILSPLPAVHDVPKGGRLSISCLVLDGNPRPFISWFVNGRPLQPGHGLAVYQDRLEISRADMGHEANYSCLASNVGGSASETTEVNVLYEPVISSADVIEFDAIEGSWVNMPCRVTGDPKPSILWYKNGIELRSDDVFELEADGGLTIKNIRESEEGEYMCKATNVIGTSDQARKLLVKVPPRIEAPEASYNITEGNRVVLPCIAYAKPPATIRWIRVDSSSSNLDRYVMFDGSLQFVGTFEDRGTYVCEAKNEVGVDRSETKLNVYVRPSALLRSPEEVVARVSETVSMVCEGTGYPEPKISWMKDGHGILDRQEGRISFDAGTLTLQHLEVFDEGEYACVAENSVGSARDGAFLYVHEKPFISPVHSTPEHLSAIVGDKIDIICNATGHPAPEITWNKSKNDIVHTLQNGRRHIPYVQETDAGVYVCVAQNVAGFDTRSFNLSVYAPPVLSSVPQRSVEVVTGNEVLLDCSTVAFPPPEVLWLKDGAVIAATHGLEENKQVLRITQADVSDAGHYVCIVKNPAGEVSNEFEVSISVPPNFTTAHVHEWQVVIDDSVTLDCSANGSPPLVFVWRKNGQLMTSSLNPTSEFGHSRSVLHISKVRESDAGTYTCIVMNKVGTSDRDFQVSVLVPPAIQGDSTEEKEVLVHQMTDIHCAVSGSPPPGIVWYRNGTELLIDGHRTFLENDHQKLILLKPGEADSGTYSCVATNRVGHARRDTHLSILTPPFIENQVDTETFRIKEGERLTLKCDASGSPPPKVLWMKNSQPLPVHEPPSNNLVIENATRRDAGRYICIASNKAGSTEKDHNVVVMSPPKMETSTKVRQPPHSRNYKKEAFENSPVSLTCPFSAYPPPHFTWLKDQVVVSPSPLVSLSEGGKVLHIKYAKLQYSGAYECIARNEAGESRQAFLLDVMVPPFIESDPIANIEVKENDPLILKCDAVGNPSPSVLWLKDGSELEPNSEFQFSPDSSHLEIVNATEQHSGLYVCIASNVVGSSEKEFNVDILTSPHLNGNVEEFQGRSTAYVNKPVTLRCPVSGNPSPQIRWFRNGTGTELDEESQNVFIHEDGQKLSMLRPRETDSDVYICLADNGIGSVSYEFALDILVPPTIEKRGLKKVHYVKEGDPVTVRCPVRGHPAPIITWLKDSDVLLPQASPHIHFSDGQQSLRLLHASLRDAGTYTCIAGNEIGTDEVDFKLDIQVPPKLQNVGERPENKSSIVNKPVTLSCPVSGVPQPQVKWFKDGRSLSARTSPNIMLSADSRHLKIFRTEIDDAGIYVCTASNNVGKVDKEFFLSVYVPPKIIEPNVVLDYYSEDEDEARNELRAVESETAELECYVEGNPKPLILWIKDGHVLLSTQDGPDDDKKRYRLSHSGQLLQVNDVRPSDAGLYTCVASNVAGTKEKNFVLDIHVPPKIRGSSFEAHDVMPNRPAEIECHFDSNPPSHISWFRDGKRLDFSEHDLIKVFNDGRVLQFLKANSKDRGQYTCVVENIVGKTEKNFNIDVYALPSISGSEAALEVLEGEKVLMECGAKGNPEPTIVWLREGQIITVDHQKNMSVGILNQGSELLVPSAGGSHAGKYKCIASNVAGAAEKTFEIYVKVPPKIVATSEPSMTVLINQPVSMLCSVEAEPAPRIMWTKDGQPIHDLTNPFFSILDDGQRLQLLRARESDGGQYSCKVSNIAGNDTRQFMLNVLVPPRVKNILDEVKSVTSTQGNGTQIRCYVHGNPQPAVAWLKNGKPLFPGKNKNIHFLERDQVLVFDSVEAADSGQYSCIASSPLGTLKRNFELNVYVPPKIQGDFTENYIAYLNKPLMIYCVSEGVPRPQVTWMKNGLFLDPFLDLNVHFLKEDSALLIKWARMEDAGKYTCIATNPAGQEEKSFNVHVYIPAYIENIGLDDKVLGVLNQTVVLKCPAHGVPPPTISWLKEGSLIQHSSTDIKYQVFEGGKTLQINSVKERDSGKYKCFATNDAGTDSVQFTLDVMVPPKLTSGPGQRKDVRLREGDSVVLRCPVEESGSYAMKVTWRKDGRRLDSGSAAPPHFEFLPGHREVRIRKSQAEDTGAYACFASNSAGETEYDMDVLVSVQPRILHPSENVSVVFVKEHHSITLECIASGHPAPTINWLRNGYLVVEGHNVHFPTDGKMKILHASPNDTAVYSCVAENEDDFDIRHYNLTVYVPPVINLSSHGLHKVTLQKGEISLDCPADGIPPPRVIWYKGSHMLVAGPRMSISGDGQRLRISHATATDAGKYTCLAVNEAGDTEAEHFVKVHVPPTIEEKSGSAGTYLNSVENGSVRLHCDVHGLPFPNITWSKEGALIRPSEDVRFSYAGAGRYLDIQNLSTSDSGRYECYAENVAGHARKEVKLSVAVPPKINEDEETKDYVVVLGKPLRIDCGASGTPPPTITWLKNGLPVTDKENVQFRNDGFTMLLTYSLPEDAAEYTCIATNNAGFVEQKFAITVLVPPTLLGDADTEEDSLSTVIGSSKQFDCSATGQPPPDILWSKDGYVLTGDDDFLAINGSHLQLTNIDLSHSGSYTCEASNVAGKISKTFHLNVFTPPKIEGSDETTFITTSVRSPVTVACPSSGIPFPTTTWFRNGIPLITGYFQNFHIQRGGVELIFPSPDLKDSGKYVCLASNFAGNDSRSFVLNVLEPPTIATMASVVKAHQGKEVVLECPAKGLPQPSISWIKDDALIPHLSSKLVQRSSLLLDNLKLQDSGIYTCIASNEVGFDTRDVELQVGAAPVIKDAEVYYKVLSGDTVFLSCDATGHPTPNKIWLKDSILVHNSSERSLSPDGTLVLSDVDASDSGVYECLAENEVGSQEAVRYLSVLTPPSIANSSSSERYETTQAQAAVLHCQAEGTPPPAIHWEHNSATLDLRDPRFKLLPSGSLHISLAQSSDMGTYTCIAKNEAGSATKNIDLFVFVPPAVTINVPRKVVVTKGRPLNITCSASGFPVPKVTWQKNGNVIPLSANTDTSGQINFESVQPEDRGNYACMASNSAGRDQESFSLEVHVPPVITTLPRSQDVLLGDPITLVCEATGNPTPSVTWLLNNTQILGSAPSVLGRTKLSLENVGKDDQGTYVCLAQNVAGERKAAAAVRIRAPPVILESSDVESVQVKETVILNCLVKGDPLPNIIWIKNGHQVELNHRIHLLQNGSLFIYNSSDHDSGEYKCVARNDFGSSERVAELIIRSKPRFVVEPHNTRVEAGADVHMHCRAKGEPRPSLHWTRGEFAASVHNADRLIVFPNNTLKIVAVQPSDEDVYTCNANNSLGHVYVQAQLIVQVHGKWSQWQEWGGCSSPCGDGVQIRRRSCDDPAPKNGGKRCIGLSSEAKYCNLRPCPVSGEWGNWLEWEPCSRTCGVGLRKRHRRCDNPQPEFGGEDCTGMDVETTSCILSKCSVDGQWSRWSEWQPCTVSCGQGSRRRHRECNDPEPLHGGVPCFGEAQEIEDCEQEECPIHGEWGEWSEWSLCTASCGGGVRERSRQCDSPKPSHGGHHCSGSHLQTDYCNNAQCPVNGNWGEWSQWGECSASCNKGQRKRFRACDNPEPAGGGRDCTGPAQQTESCSTYLCPVDGKWSDWSAWSSCSATCGVGVRSRTRTCNGPEPLHGGKECSGDGEELEECADEACDAMPLQAAGHLIGVINGIDFGLSRLVANVSQVGMEQLVSATLHNVTADVADWLRLLVPLLSPIYWTTAYEMGPAANGYTTTKGFFRRETQVNFATDQVLYMTHIARGLDKRGVLLVDIVLSGEVPPVPASSTILLHPYTEDYVQVGPGTIYAFSTRTYEIKGHILPYSWNHSIYYDEILDGMPFLTQRLYVNTLGSRYDEDLGEMLYTISAAIGRGHLGEECAPGFLLSSDGFYCLDVDECEAEDGGCSHVCSNFPGGFSCQCFNGFILDLDGKSCNDVDECVSRPSTCSAAEECFNTHGSFKCLIVCRSGYKRSQDELYCEDVNECETNGHNCSQICTNTIGGYSCSCHDGYSLVGKTDCLDVDECHSSNKPCSHFCTNTVGSFVCTCPPGFELRGDTMCIDVDECYDQLHTCLPFEVCKNTVGSYECHPRCVVGLKSASNGSCVDVDECDGTGFACHFSQVCINTHGSYYCSCFRGYYSDGPGNPCIDINECLQRPSPCGYDCHNLPGDYECVCAPGLKRLPDRKTCAGIEYLKESRGLPHRPAYLSSGRNRSSDIFTVADISSSPAQNYTRCPAGFHFNHGICQDINECDDKGRCQHLCENTQGSYRCLCPAGYQLEPNGKKCLDIDECIESDIDCGPDQMCFNTRGSYECIETPCPHKYERDPITGYCILECAKATGRCPPNVKYSEILAFKMVALPSGIQPYQDLVRLVAYDQDGRHLPNTVFSIVENDTGVPFRIRLEGGRGLLYTQRSLESRKEYKIKVQAVSYDTDHHTIQYKTQFLVFVSVSQYPY